MKRKSVTLLDPLSRRLFQSSSNASRLGGAGLGTQLMDREIQLLHPAVGHLFFLALDVHLNHFTTDGNLPGHCEIAVVTLFVLDTDFAGNFQPLNLSIASFGPVELESFVIVTPAFLFSFILVSERINKTCFLAFLLHPVTSMEFIVQKPWRNN